MSEAHQVHIRVISQKGTCERGHKVGDEWLVNGGTPPGMCLEAFHALYPNLRVLKFGGSFEYEEDPDVTTATCPDGRNPVIFELRRITE